MLWENRPAQDSKQGCTYPIMVEMLSGILNRGVDGRISGGRISGHFDTKCMTILRTEQILYNFEDQKIANFFNHEQVNFCVTLVICQ